MRQPLTQELLRARAAFDRHGRIPYDNACRLMALGVMVSQLEDMWARTADASVH